jgi:hypothetical protein
MVCMLAIFCSVPAGALTVSVLIGDKDGFGTGVVDGELIMPSDVVTEVDDDYFTDQIVFGTQSLDFNYDLSRTFPKNRSGIRLSSCPP